MSTATAKKPRERLSLHESVELLRLLDQAVEDNIDEIELNGGALPDWMASMFDEVAAAMVDRADAIAAVVDEMKGNVSSAKATKDRAARREKVWGNVIDSIKRYVAREIERNGGEPIRGTASVLRLQRNSQASTELTMPEQQATDYLLYCADQVDHSGNHTNPLARFIVVERMASLNKKALSDAYEARAAELESEAELLGESDVPDDVIAGLHGSGTPADPDDIAQEITRMRADYVQRALSAEFPGVRCIRGSHVRID